MMQKFKIIRNRLLQEREMHTCRELLSFFDEPWNEKIGPICSSINNHTTKIMVHELMDYLVDISFNTRLKKSDAIVSIFEEILLGYLLKDYLNAVIDT